VVRDVTSRAFRIPLLILGAVVGLLLAVALAVRLLVDPNDYRATIERQFLASTGRELRLAGPLELAFWPRLAVRTGPFTVANERGFGAEALLTASNASLSLRLWPLLQRRYEIGRVDLVAPKARLQVDRNGRDNWSSLYNRPDQPAAQPAAESVDRSLAIAGVHIADGELVYDDRRADTNVAIRDWTLDAGPFAAAQPVEFRSSFAFTTAPGQTQRTFEIAGSIGQPTPSTWTLRNLRGTVGWPIAGNAPLTPIEFEMDEAGYDTVGHAVAVPAFGLRIADARLSGAVRGTLGRPATALKGSLRLQPTPLKNLLTAFGVEPPVTRDEDALGPFGFESTLSYGPRGVALDDIAGKLGATGFRGFVRRTTGADAFEFGLDLDDIDLDRYLPPKATSEQPRPPEADRASGGDSTRSGLRASGRLTANHLRVSGLDLQKLQASVRLVQDRVRIDPLQAHVFGGDLVSSVNYDLHPSAEALSLDLRLSRIDIASLLEQFVHDQRLKGRGSLTANLSGRGTGDRLVSSLAGPFELKIVDGSYAGVDLWYEIERALTVAQGRAPASRPASPQTPFDRFSTTGRLAGSVLDVQRFDLVNSYLAARGKGQVDYRAVTGDLSLVARLLKSPEGNVAGLELSHLTDIEIPVTVRGPLADPQVRPDIGRLLESAAKQQLRKEGEKVEKKLKDKVEDALKGLLGQ
jgi:AsmA protein